MYCIFDFHISKIEGDMCTASWVFFSSFLWHVLVIMLLFKSPLYTFRLEHQGYESVPLPSYRWIMNCSYPIISKYIYSHICVTIPPFTRPVPTTSWVDYTPSYPRTTCIDHRWYGSECALQWWPNIAECNNWWDKYSRVSL